MIGFAKGQHGAWILAAACNRNRIVDAAEQRFLGDGYGLTTVAAIAGDAGVSADTIYKSFGGKPGLVRAIPRGRSKVRARSRPSDDRTRSTTMNPILARSSRPGARSPLKWRPESRRSCSSSAPRPRPIPKSPHSSTRWTATTRAA